MEKSFLEKLAEVNPEAELWWDSSPLVYENWSNQVLDNAPVERREVLKAQMKKIFDPADAKSSIVKGVTTNPPLSLNVFKDQPEYWAEHIDNLIDEDPNVNTEDLFWKVYKDVLKKGSEVLLDLFESSNYKLGYLSGQVDPRNVTDYDKMYEQALEIHAINPNVMVKVPGSKEGYDLIKTLTSKGIATNNTTSFTLPQFVACAKAVKEGLEIAKQNGIDLDKWRSVITAMSARYGMLGNLQKEAEEKGFELSEGDTRLAEIAIFKKAIRFLEEGNYPSKMLYCSLRTGPVVNGETRVWHLEHVAGANIVYTLPPKYIGQLLEMDYIKELPDRYNEPIPQELMDKLMQLPYFTNAYSENGINPEDFASQPAFVATAQEFSVATEKMVEFVNTRLKLKTSVAD